MFTYTYHGNTCPLPSVSSLSEGPMRGSQHPQPPEMRKFSTWTREANLAETTPSFTGPPRRWHLIWKSTVLNSLDHSFHFCLRPGLNVHLLCHFLERNGHPSCAQPTDRWPLVAGCRISHYLTPPTCYHWCHCCNVSFCQVLRLVLTVGGWETLWDWCPWQSCPLMSTSPQQCSCICSLPSLCWKSLIMLCVTPTNYLQWKPSERASKEAGRKLKSPISYTSMDGAHRTMWS